MERKSSAGRVRDFGRGLLLSEYFVLYLTIAYFLVLAFFFPDLVSARNISNQLSNVWPLLVVSIGQTFVILIAGIDLSLGAIMGFVSVAGAAVMAKAADELLLGGSPLWGIVIDENGGLLAGHAAAVPVAIALMLVVGSLIGAFNGIAVSRLKMPSFMVTLVSLMFFASAAIWLTQSQNIINLPETFTKLGAGDIVSFYFGEKPEPQIKRRDVLPFVTYPMLIAIAVASSRT